MCALTFNFPGTCFRVNSSIIKRIRGNSVDLHAKDRSCVLPYKEVSNDHIRKSFVRVHDVVVPFRCCAAEKFTVSQPPILSSNGCIM